MVGEDDSAALFRKQVGKVRPVEHDTVEPERPRRPPRRRPSEPAVAASDTDGGHGAPGTRDKDAALAYEYSRPGLQRSVLRKLRRAQYSIGDELDLHGLTVRAAHQRLASFLVHARGERLACVRIVTGKGLSSPGMDPVLKPKVAAWLREDDGVLAFTTARRNDGGSGALYVLLRRRCLIS